jgi:hypothetical protein
MTDLLAWSDGDAGEVVQQRLVILEMEEHLVEPGDANLIAYAAAKRASAVPRADDTSWRASHRLTVRNPEAKRVEQKTFA